MVLRNNDKTVLSSIYERFVEESPVTVMTRLVMERCLSPEIIDEIFGQAADRQYNKDLLFSTTFQVMSEAVCNVHRSVRAAYQARQPKAGPSVVALYGKLQRTEPGVLVGLVRHTAQTLGPLIRETGGELPPLLPGYTTRILDGSAIAATERRLKVLRGVEDAPLPGKALVVLDPQQMLIAEMIPCPDGHAQERILLPQTLLLVRKGELWIADRNMCTLGWVEGVDRAEACFVVRQHGQFPLEPLENFHRVGRNKSGVISEQKVRVKLPSGEERIWRRLRVELDQPTRNEDKEIFLLTNLPLSQATAPKVADVYLERWTIERMFQEIEATLHCEINTLAYPKAALFGLCVGLVAHNVLAVVKAAMRAAHGVETVEQKVSGYYMADELESTYRGMQIALPEEAWEPFRQMSSQELAQELVRIARRMHLRRYEKHPRGPKKPQPPRKRLGSSRSSHVSTARLLAAASS